LVYRLKRSKATVGPLPTQNKVELAPLKTLYLFDSIRADNAFLNTDKRTRTGPIPL